MDKERKVRLGFTEEVEDMFDKDTLRLMSLSKFKYKDLDKEQEKILNKYETYYNSFKRKNNSFKEYINNEFRVYSCYDTYKDFRNLDEIIDVVKSDESDIDKTFKLCDKINSSYALFDNYKYLIVPNINTDKIQDFIDTYQFYVDKEEKGYVANVHYINSIKFHLDKYESAKELVEGIINRGKKTTIKEYRKENNIYSIELQSALKTLKIINMNLYKEYQTEELKEKLELVRLKELKKNMYKVLLIHFSNIVEYIDTGKIDDKPFDILEFFKIVPFKKEEQFYNTLRTFTSKNLPKDDYYTIMKFLKDNGINIYSKSKIVPLDTKALYNPNNKNIINGREITKEDNEVILKWMKQNEYPIYNITFKAARMKYVNGEFTKDDILEEKQEKMLKLKRK